MTGASRPLREGDARGKPMGGIRRDLSRRLAYGPRFRRHYRHRRQAGYSIALAFRSTRVRMQEYNP
jgi:hypothetical protein